MKRLAAALVLSLLLGVTSLYLIAPEDFSRDAIQAVTRPDAVWLALFLAPVLAWWLLSAWRISFLTGQTSRPTSLWQGVQTHVIGTFSAVATPAGGGNSIGIVLMLRRFGMPLNEAVSVAVMSVVGDMAFFAWAVPASYFTLRAAGVTLSLGGLGFLVTGVSLVALTASYLLVFRLPLATWLLRRLFELPFIRRLRGRSDAFLANLDEASKRYSRRPWHWHLRFLLLSSVARLPYFLVLNLILVGLSVPAEHLVVYTAQVLLHAFAFVIPTPGASGYQEAAVSYALRGHVRASSLAVSIILWRLYAHYLYFVVGPLVGGALLLRVRRGGRTPAEAAAGGGERGGDEGGLG